MENRASNQASRKVLRRLIVNKWLSPEAEGFLFKEEPAIRIMYKKKNAKLLMPAITRDRALLMFDP